MRESYDPTPPSSWLGRARFTPLLDALRGQFTARLDPRTLIATAELPAPLPELIYTVVRRSRLWPREQVDVARELVAHFADGLSAGRAPEQLATDFGPAAQAARLIRRGKIRNRPYLWHAGRFALRAAGVATLVFIAFYGLLAARFYFSEPNLAHNYWREVNEGRFAPENASAWPLYREAIVKLDKKPKVDGEWLEEGINGPHWDALKSVVERQGDAIDLTRAGAKKPHLNYALANPADREYFHANNADWLIHGDPQTVDENLPLFEALLPGPQSMRDLARLLVADCLVAAAAGDGKRFVEDFTALLSMSEQLSEPPTFLVEQLISFAIVCMDVRQLGQVLANDPKFLTNEQLRELAHRVAAYRHGNIDLDFGSERALFDDMLQRAFTDDGHGDGHVTATGLNLVPELAAIHAAVDIPRATWLVGPGLSAIVAGRAETREITDKHFNETLAAHQGPPWLWNSERIQASEDWRKTLTSGPLKIRYMFPALLLPGMGHAFGWVESTIQQRDATEVAIALVLFHRRHGTWPQTLEELVPDLLPAVPPDRYDGQPLRYIVRDGKPILYSIGVDRDDDGGQPTKNPDRAMQGPFGPVVPDPFERADEEGDWILWPPVPATPAEAAVTSPAAEEE